MFRKSRSEKTQKVQLNAATYVAKNLNEKEIFQTEIASNVRFLISKHPTLSLMKSDHAFFDIPLFDLFNELSQYFRSEEIEFLKLKLKGDFSRMKKRKVESVFLHASLVSDDYLSSLLEKPDHQEYLNEIETGNAKPATTSVFLHHRFFSQLFENCRMFITSSILDTVGQSNPTSPFYQPIRG